MGLAILLGICAVCVLVLGIKTQNRLAPLRARVDEATANIKACVQKRNRLIKQLIDIAATYAKHEKELHQRISSDFNTPNDIERNPRAALVYVSRLVNMFPELRADRTYLSLSNDLGALESELLQKFEQHSASVREYNSVRLSFPNDMFSWFGGFGVAEHLDGTESSVTETKKARSVKPIDLNRVVNPRVGMHFRDTKDNFVFKIVEVRTDSLLFNITRESMLENRVGSGGWITIEHWKECVAEGRYQVE